jgi:hypothetical protein
MVAEAGSAIADPQGEEAVGKDRALDLSRDRSRGGIDFASSGDILYVSSIDVSVGNGPGVNEREFIHALHAAMGSRAHFLIPEPEHPVSDLPLSDCTFTRPHRRHHPLHFLAHSWSKVRRARALLAERHFDMLVFRLDVLPVAALLITRKCGTPYALKTLGQNSLKIWAGASRASIDTW